ncbi:ATP-binding protein [Sphingomonas sp. BK069]|uniref:ATP-binding protein n=1 Tax=Sphingomonas sp. BK069 TaxID=2586979 RepID=UPI001607FA0F|nr:ATP-binding protein [Sphingomonas sp. BK069]MBB3349008.1 signal transduction histidine kinase [Sphingomonas sp. BK069]
MRRSLALLVLAGVIPIVALGGTFGALTLRSEREAVAARGRTDANLAAALVSQTLRSNVAAVEMVAQSPALDGAAPDVARFATLARRILANQQDWHAIVLADVEGRVVFGTAPVGTAAAPLAGLDAAVLRRLRDRAEPQIGTFSVASDGARVFPVAVPVGRAGQVRYVVAALVPAARLERLLRVEPLAPGWTASIITPAGPALMVPRDAAPLVHTDPRPVELWMPVSGARWSVRITAPAQAFFAPVRQAVLLLLAAAALCILLLALLGRLLVGELRQLRRRDASELQRQRMETLGRLTGGVAHDFNNLLTPIMISLEQLRRHAADAASTRHVDVAMAGAERARLLVSRLLAFSRQQQLSPEPVELAALVDGLMDLVEKSLTPAITMTVAVAPELCAAEADRGQLELAILNLVINARDAMPDGGALRLSVARAEPRHTAGLAAGHYVAITVSDTGSGMDAATIARAIDPFFTTKPIGKGTGLGLSMVDGFASQSGGAFVLESEPGRGTSARIVLPCSARPAVAAPLAAAAAGTSALTILLVDDDLRVRRATAEVLAEAGHAVTEAADVDEALALLATREPVDVVVTDFIMPGRSGAELIEQLRAAWPHVAVLMVTGHVEDDGALPDGVELLRKPYRGATLLAAVEQAVRQRGR